MNMHGLTRLFSTFKVESHIFHNGQYCGNWSVDISGAGYISFHMITHGRCEIEVGAETIKLEAGDWVLLPQDSKHCISNDVSKFTQINTSQSHSFVHGIDEGGTGLVCGYFTYKHPMMNQIIATLPSTIVLKHNQVAPSIKLVMQALMTESLTSDKQNTFILNKLSECLLAMVFREEVQLDNGVLAALTHPKLFTAVDHIHENIDGNYTVAQLADMCFMTESSFAKLFKQVSGQSPKDYANQWKLAQAYNWLKDEKITTLSAALKCGYQSEAAFSKAFKRVIGTGPGSVRAA